MPARRRTHYAFNKNYFLRVDKPVFIEGEGCDGNQAAAKNLGSQNRLDLRLRANALFGLRALSVFIPSRYLPRTDVGFRYRSKKSSVRLVESIRFFLRPFRGHMTLSPVDHELGGAAEPHK